MPLVTALKSMKLAWVRPAMMRARVVFPTPGGPQKIMEEMRSWSINCRKIFPSPKRCSCPTNSSRVRGRIRLANGRSIPCCPNKVCCSIRRLRSYRFFYFTTGGRKGQEQSFALDEAQAGNAKPYIKRKQGTPASVRQTQAFPIFFPGEKPDIGSWKKTSVMDAPQNRRRPIKTSADGYSDLLRAAHGLRGGAR